ncbi:14499_t:CDS:1, partial [Dentiscutata heterogama]
PYILLKKLLYMKYSTSSSCITLLMDVSQNKKSLPISRGKIIREKTLKEKQEKNYFFQSSENIFQTTHFFNNKSKKIYGAEAYTEMVQF